MLSGLEAGNALALVGSGQLELAQRRGEPFPERGPGRGRFRACSRRALPRSIRCWEMAAAGRVMAVRQPSGP